MIYLWNIGTHNNKSINRKQQSLHCEINCTLVIFIAPINKRITIKTQCFDFLSQNINQKLYFLVVTLIRNNFTPQKQNAIFFFLLNLLRNQRWLSHFYFICNRNIVISNWNRNVVIDLKLLYRPCLFNLSGYFKTRRPLIRAQRKPAAIFQSLTATRFEQYGDRATQWGTAPSRGAFRS